MKKKYLIALSVIIMLGALVWFREPIRAGIGAFALNTGVTQPRNTDGAISTSTLNYLTPGTGTTSVTVNTRGTDQVDLNIFLLASTTATTDLRWTVEFSHSTSSIASEQLWFPLAEELAINATTTFRSALAKEFGWIPDLDARHAIATSTNADGIFTSLTASTRISLKDIAANWTRVIFYIPTGSLTNNQADTLAESTALSSLPNATSTNAGIAVFLVNKDPL